MKPETQEKRKKPPIGLKPRRLHDLQRRHDIYDAILRFTAADVAVPEEWVYELITLEPHRRST